MIYFTAHTIKCVCHSIRTMFGVLGMYNFGHSSKKERLQLEIGLLLLHSTTNLQHYSLHVYKSLLLAYYCVVNFLNKPQI